MQGRETPRASLKGLFEHKKTAKKKKEKAFRGQDPNYLNLNQAGEAFRLPNKNRTNQRKSNNTLS